MFKWLAGKGADARAVARVLGDIPLAHWQQVIGGLPFLGALTADEITVLKQKAAWLLASKTFHGAQGFQVTQAVGLSIAVQAALPILHLPTRLYEGWTEIIVYPGEFLIPRQDIDIDAGGVVHDYVQPASGESWDGGPVVLAWNAVVAHNTSGMNVVIHEFAHKLDIQASGGLGMPDLSGSGIAPTDWQQVLAGAFTSFDAWLTLAEDSIPHDVDPESDDAAPWFDALPLDPYAATDVAEFFAVSSEAFFVAPGPLRDRLPDWYGLLARYYRQDPWRRLG